MGKELPFDSLTVFDTMLDFLKSLEGKPKPKKSSGQKAAEEKAREEKRGNAAFKIKTKNCPASDEERRREIREGKRRVGDDNNQAARERVDNTKKVKFTLGNSMSKERDEASTSVFGPSSEQRAPTKPMFDLNLPPPDDY